MGLNYEFWFSDLLFWWRKYEFLRRKRKAQRRRKNTILRHICALSKDGARLFVQIKACPVNKAQSFALRSQ
jgi:hypothetical protein